MKDVINYQNESDAASVGQALRPAESCKTIFNRVLLLRKLEGLPLSFDAFPNKICTFVAMKVNIDPSWGEHLQAEFDAPTLSNLPTLCEQSMHKVRAILPDTRYSMPSTSVPLTR